jgi:hydroxymethylpyrimidine kinase/phosphomethylpyrimidine kinase
VKVPCALTIAGSDSGGGAGIAADLKTFAALGVHGLCVVTAVTAQNTQGVDAIFELSPEFVSQQLDTLMRDFEVEWAKTGMLSNADIIRAVEEGAKRYGLRLVVDPVMVSATGAPLLRADALHSLIRLIGRAELVTPNVPEAQKLSGVKIHGLRDMRVAARAIAKLGPKAVLVKGGHLAGKEVVDLLYADGKYTVFIGPRVPGKPAHGTGCSFSAAITAGLARGLNLRRAVEGARDFIAKAVEGKLDVGKGVKPVNPITPLLLDAERWRALQDVWAAAQLLTSAPKFARLIPEVGTNIAVVPLGARTPSDVIGLSGRIIRVGGKPKLTGFPMLGGSEHVANIALTAFKHDPRIRAAMNLRFSQAILRACRKLGLTIASFDRSREPRGVKTMVWGTEQAIRKTGTVPDVIFDRGARGKEAMIRLLGRSAVEVAELAMKIARIV